MIPFTIAYLTGRKEPHFEWFCRSLVREAGKDLSRIDVLFVDFYAEPQRPGEDWTSADVVDRTRFIISQLDGAKMKNFAHVPPMGNVWQGPHRRTKENWFAKADYLNTAVCYAHTPYIVCVDDLSVLVPGWLAAVQRAIDAKVICCGHYQKVKCLKVEDGVVKSFEEYGAGRDHRGETLVEPCHPAWSYGCSIALPIEATLAINGYPQYTNGLGYEDSVSGMMMAKHGFKFRYDPAMKTFESEEDHHLGKQMRREDPGISPNDASHALLATAAKTTRFENYFGAEGLAGLRKRVLAGEPMPIMRIPEHRFFDGRALADL